MKFDGHEGCSWSFRFKSILVLVCVTGFLIQHFLFFATILRLNLVGFDFQDFGINLMVELCPLAHDFWKKMGTSGTKQSVKHWNPSTDDPKFFHGFSTFGGLT